MPNLYIKNFGPIIEAQLTLNKRVLVLIGPQSSGKSTIAKVAYFFQTVVQEQVWQTLEKRTPEEEEKTTQTAFVRNLLRQLSTYFGNQDQEGLVLRYTYPSGYAITVFLENGALRVDAEGFILEGFYKAMHAFDALAGWQAEHPNGTRQYSTAERIEAAQKENALNKAIAALFGAHTQAAYYVPAGRLLLSTVQQVVRDEALQEAAGALAKTDLFTRQFVDLARGIRTLLFNTPLDTVYRQQVDIQDGTDRSHIHKAYQAFKPLMRQILQGEYHVGAHGERIVFDTAEGEGRSVLLNYASSGQQESLFVLLTLFYLLYDHEKHPFVIVEEPEAHLFPKAQKHMVEAIATIMNAVQGQAIITTHSPYILAACNNLLYAAQVGKHKAQRVEELVPQPYWLAPEDFAAYLVKDGHLVNVLDEETKIVDPEGLDAVSDDINEVFHQLFTLED